jgi:pimeloyl-ACP methyl ester carboxylesterase
MEDYVETIAGALKSVTGPSILVGHSMTGHITQTAETVPDTIRALVYVTGILTPNGVSMLRAVEGFDPDYVAQIVWAPDRRSARIQAEGAQRFFYHLSPSELAVDAVSRFTPEPVAPFEKPIQTTTENFGRVPKYYVECLQDRAIPIALQRSMRSPITWERVYSLDTDHSPFFSKPSELSAILNMISVETGMPR